MKIKQSIKTLIGLGLLTSYGGLYAEILPVCQRTEPVKQFIEKAVKKTCEQITQEDLLLIKRIAVENKKILNFNPQDFSGLSNLEILNIRSNPFTELPEGLFKGLTNLHTLVIISGKIRHYPNDFLADTPNMAHLHVFNNPVKTISESVLVRLANLKNLKEIDFDLTLNEAEKDRLNKMFPQGGLVQLFFN